MNSTTSLVGLSPAPFSWMHKPVQQQPALVEGSQFCLSRWWTRRLARLLCASSAQSSGTRRSRSSWFCTFRTLLSWKSCRRRTGGWVGVFLVLKSNSSKKFRIAEFEHFTHQLVIVPSYPISTAGQSRLLSLLWCSLEGIRKRSSFGFWKFRSRSYWLRHFGKGYFMHS